MLVVWKEWEMNTGKESRCPESGRGKEERKTEILMDDCIKRPRKSERRMEKRSNR